MIRFRSIESLRAWMAWWVVVGHALHLTGTSPDAFDGFANLALRLAVRGDLAVKVFIIVSGFVICHLILSRPETYSKYITRRAFRIVPIYFFCLAVAMLIRPLYEIAYTQLPWVYASDMRIERAQLEMANFWQHLLLHLTVLHGVVPEEVLRYSSTAFLAPAWSLSLEWQFYLLAPIVIGVLVRCNIWSLAVSAAAFLCYWLVTASSYTWAQPSFIAIAAPYFLVGIFSRLLLTSSRRNLPIVLLVLIPSLFMVEWFVAFVWITFFLIIANENSKARNEPKIVKIFLGVVARNKILQNLGSWSYSTYLIHIPLFSIFVGVSAIAAGGDLSRPQCIVAVLVAMVFLVPLSWLLYTYVEQPFIRLSRRFQTASTQVTAG